MVCYTVFSPNLPSYLQVTTEMEQIKRKMATLREEIDNANEAKEAMEVDRNESNAKLDRVCMSSSPCQKISERGGVYG